MICLQVKNPDRSGNLTILIRILMMYWQIFMISLAFAGSEWIMRAGRTRPDPGEFGRIYDLRRRDSNDECDHDGAS
jgi:hypothetical protein